MLLSERHVVSFISTFSDVHSVMYYIFLLLLPPDGFVLCYIGLLVLTLWRFGDDVISPSPGKGRYNGGQDSTKLITQRRSSSYPHDIQRNFGGILYSFYQSF